MKVAIFTDGHSYTSIARRWQNRSILNVCRSYTERQVVSECLVSLRYDNSEVIYSPFIEQ